jgi:hypothetical protein
VSLLERKKKEKKRKVICTCTVDIKQRREEAFSLPHPTKFKKHTPLNCKESKENTLREREGRVWCDE